MPLAVVVAVSVAVVIGLMGAAGYLIERSATAHEPPADRISGPPRPD
jgi:ABC-type transport system involved in cytochrome bd biosynthesis fused ATPase/permease subunit